MLISWEVFICGEQNVHICVQRIKFISKNTILEFRVSWADICNDTALFSMIEVLSEVPQ